MVVRLFHSPLKHHAGSCETLGTAYGVTRRRGQKEEFGSVLQIKIVYHALTSEAIEKAF